MARAMMAGVLFGDVAGYSRMDDHQLKRYLKEVPRAIAGCLPKRRGELLELNTWGDGIVIASADPHALVEIALDLTDYYRNHNFAVDNLPPDLLIRIALHAGRVYVGADPIRQKKHGIIGTHVILPARLEPIVTPGEVWITEPFKAMLGTGYNPKLQFKDLGQKSLAKDAGKVRVWRVTRGPARAQGTAKPRIAGRGADPDSVQRATRHASRYLSALRRLGNRQVKIVALSGGHGVQLQPVGAPFKVDVFHDGNYALQGRASSAVRRSLDSARTALRPLRSG